MALTTRIGDFAQAAYDTQISPRAGPVPRVAQAERADGWRVLEEARRKELSNVGEGLAKAVQKVCLIHLGRGVIHDLLTLTNSCQSLIGGPKIELFDEQAFILLSLPA